MSGFGGFRLHPNKLWICDCCFAVYSCRALNKNGGICPKCANEYFSPVNDTIPLFVPEEAPKKKPVPKIKFEGGEIVGFLG